VAFALLSVVLAIGLKNAPEKGLIKSPLIGRSAPAFELPDLLDPAKTLSGKEFRGNWYVVNVWGTWCVECRVEHAQLLAMRREGRMPIIGIDWKDDDAEAITWLARLGDPYTRIGADRDGRVAIDWGVYGAPESFLVDPQGIIVAKQVGVMTAEIWARWLREHVDRADDIGARS
jgi:cytochrome c biogenesis protein CcmG/thiol:disulfide interchange protein DsbE